MEKDPVIVLDLKPYCHCGCEDLDTKVINYYANDEVYRQVIKCKNEYYCERLAKVISKFYEHKSEEE